MRVDQKKSKRNPNEFMVKVLAPKGIKFMVKVLAYEHDYSSLASSQLYSLIIDDIEILSC